MPSTPANDHEIYCPVCERLITASNIKEVEDGDNDSYLFVHDEVIHTESDMDALMIGIQ